MKKQKRKMTHMSMLAIGFFVLILTGTILLMTPFANKQEGVGFINALFTATSATCVTGLIVADTYQQWTVFGQLVIITLIQIGGLGFMTIGVYIAVMLKRKIGLSEREALHQSVNTIEVAGVVRLTKRIIKGTLIFEGIGAILLAIRFIPERGILKGIYYGIFHSISAFCNAGFDLQGDRQEFSSFTAYTGDIIVNITIMGLIVVGGLGFIVWEDMYRNKWHFKRYLLHSKIVITSTFILVIGGAILFFLFENNHLFADMTGKEKVLASLFSSVTPRTAGFNTVDLASLSNASKFLTILFMFIGGSSGSTAGGVKVTTLVVLLCFAGSMIKRTQGANIFGRRFDEETIKKANAVVVVNLGLAITAAMVIFATQSFQFEDVLFEVFSAIGTVGMSAGITQQLSVVSKIAIIVLMYCGRVGSLSFAVSFAQRKIMAPIQNPVEKIVVG